MRSKKFDTRSTTCTLVGFIAALAIILFPFSVLGQLDADLSTTDNTNCDGVECDYNGPSILINELMMSPSSFDGSLWGGSSSQAGEWIELYNPNICEPIDISCYYLGNNANDPTPYPGGYVIPPGTVVPPSGFALIRGINAAPVPAELLIENGGNVVELVVTGDGVCTGGGPRLWFPNAGGWFAFYDSNGVPQDAVSWANQSNITNDPCVPTLTGCGFTGDLPNYDDFPDDRKNYILNVSAADFQGQSLRRIPDGGAWAGPGNPTYADCNAGCIDSEFLVCNGTATAEPQGGVPPFVYLWDDVRAQTTQTAIQLCAGEYCVQIIDALNDTIEQCVTVEDAYYEILLSDGFCEGETFTLPDNSTVTEGGEYIVLFETAGGCDSLVTIQLETYPNYNFTLNPEICENETYTLPDGNEVSTANTYTVTLETIHGCDSVYEVNLTVLPLVNVTQTVEICEGSSHQLPDGTVVSEAGIYEVVMPGSQCDTTFSIEVQILPIFDIEITEHNDISCFGEIDGNVTLNLSNGTAPYNFVWSDGQDHGANATDLPPGNYNVQITDANGCENDVAFEIAEPQSVSITASADTLICLGSETVLTAQATGGTGDFTYHWSHSSSELGTVSESPTEDTEYTVYATDENGCETETLTLSVTVIDMDENLLETIAGDPVCSGGATTLEAFYDGEHPPYSYQWSHGLPASPGPHSVEPTETTNYTVTVSDECGNEVTEIVTITIFPLPAVQLVNISDVSCFGLNDGFTTIDVDEGTEPYSFIWSDGQDHGTNATDLPPGSYSVQITDANGCENDVAFEIAEPQSVSITASVDTLICLGSETALNAQATGGTGAFTYHWSHSSSELGTVSESPTEDTEYTVYATDENGCETETLTLSVTVIDMDENLLETIAGDPVCSGGATTVEAFYNGEYPPYSYQWSHGLPATPGPHSVEPTETTNYTVIVTDDCGNIVTETVTVTIFPLPEVQIVSTSDITCFGLNDGSAEINVENGTPDYTYQWSASNSNGPTANNLSPGTHQVLISDANNCSDSLTFSISEPAPIHIEAFSDTLVCPGDVVSLTAQASGGIGTLTFHWAPDVPDGSQHDVTVDESTLFTVFASDSNGCNSESIELPVEVITMDDTQLTVQNGGNVCPGAESTVSATYSGSHPPYTYSWNNGIANGSGPHTVEPEETTSYTVEVTDQCNNSVIGSTTVEILPFPVINLPDVMAEGCATLDVLFEDTVNNTSNHSHVWSVNQSQFFTGSTFSYSFSEPGIHEIELSVTSHNGCNAASESPSLVIVKPSPNAEFTATPWETGIDEPEVQFTDLSFEDILEWHWSFGDGSSSEIQHPTYQYGDTGTYVVELLVINEYECADSITHRVRIKPIYDITVPTAFTPTSPGGNGYYDPSATNNDIFYAFAEYVEEFRMSIFNRWGELIFESLDINYGWNGTYRGEPCPQDVYVYKFEFVFSDGANITEVGDVTLFR